MSTHAYLTSTGWTDWATIAELIGADQCLWADLGGLRHADAPRQLPIGATHLWSWRPDRWLRIRIDSGKALATILTPDKPSGVPCMRVVMVETDGIPWRNHDRARECHLQVTLRRTEGAAPITFAEVRTAADPDG